MELTAHDRGCRCCCRVDVEYGKEFGARWCGRRRRCLRCGRGRLDGSYAQRPGNAVQESSLALIPRTRGVGDGDGELEQRLPLVVISEKSQARLEVDGSGLIMGAQAQCPVTPGAIVAAAPPQESFDQFPFGSSD